MLEEYLNKIINGDCLEVLSKFPDRCIDIVVTSPPYNLKKSTGNGMKNGRGGKCDIVYDVPLRQIIIWKRKGGINFNESYFLPTYEVIYLIAKKDFKLVKGANAYGDVWEITQELRNDHPAPFPVELVDRIVSSTNAQIILDPFMGSGTTAVVASGLGRDFIGIEKSSQYCERAMHRLEMNKTISEVAKFHQQFLFARNPKHNHKTKDPYEHAIKSLF